jgi:hypothetical protein
MKTAIALARLNNQFKTVLFLLEQTRLKDNARQIISKLDSLISANDPTETNINTIIEDTLSLIDQDMQSISVPANTSIFLDHFASLYQINATFAEIEDISVENRTRSENSQQTIKNKSKLPENSIKNAGEILTQIYTNASTTLPIKSHTTLSTVELKSKADYLYEENDINAILKARFNEEAKKAKAYLALHRSTIHLVSATANAKLSDGKPEWLHMVKGQLQQHIGRAGTLLIPYNQGGGHWVGLILAFDKNAKITTLQYMNSMSSDNEMHKIHAELQSEKLLSSEFNKGINCVNLAYLKQDDGTTCGAYTIENLMLAAQNLHTPSPLSSAQVRALHLNCLKQYDPQYYHNSKDSKGTVRMGFYERQLYNISTILSTKQPSPTDKTKTLTPTKI